MALGLAGLAAFASVAFRHEEPAPAARTAVAIALQTLGNLGAPITSVENAGDSRLFLTIQTGRILIWDGTSFLTTPFLDISSLVSCCTERGLLSAAFHPHYATNGFFFVYYTRTAGNVTVARYTVSSGNPNLANPASGVVLLTIPHPTNANHNGGQLQFGPDGFLPATRNAKTSCSGSSCASTSTRMSGAPRSTGSRLPTRSSEMGCRLTKSGPRGCAIRGGSPSTG